MAGLSQRDIQSSRGAVAGRAGCKRASWHCRVHAHLPLLGISVLSFWCLRRRLLRRLQCWLLLFGSSSLYPPQAVMCACHIAPAVAALSAPFQPQRSCQCAASHQQTCSAAQHSAPGSLPRDVRRPLGMPCRPPQMPSPSPDHASVCHRPAAASCAWRAGPPATCMQALLSIQARWEPATPLLLLLGKCRPYMCACRALLHGTASRAGAASSAARCAADAAAAPHPASWAVRPAPLARVQLPVQLPVLAAPRLAAPLLALLPESSLPASAALLLAALPGLSPPAALPPELQPALLPVLRPLAGWQAARVVRCPLQRRPGRLLVDVRGGLRLAAAAWPSGRCLGVSRWALPHRHPARQGAGLTRCCTVCT